ncbi:MULTISPECIES: EAL and HDOD domain-containing protein [Lacrimispora]|jgi:EAL and modified HD-GYP domain-containing signal transduction protein|uniref:EAL and HDOD domain-containing protein n=1 Tax=Lacrimispora TaxID=2719231 RepID=UPI0008AC3175|nr:MULTISPECIES: HDOD domain-containing protein [Lacrimispora]MDR7813464.1 HDOD domain-containing protein [Lacrimispora sp.]SET95648.1 EAL and modified HD-GYP domain-containing signal transduction protein [Lacrimispora sphenoides]
MDRYVTRQPIKALKEDRIIGYEVLFQKDYDALYNSTDVAAADTIAGFLMQNTERIFQDKLTFVTFTPSLLFRNMPKIFDKDKLIIQIEDHVMIHPLSPAIIKRYRTEGYIFAINDFQFSPKYFTMLDYVTYIKVDISNKHEGRERVSLNNLINTMKGFDKKCIATGVNTKEDYELAMEVGADYAEGSYVAEAMAKKVKRMEFLEGNFFQLVVEVSKDEPDIEQIEKVISHDAALSYALLKIVNSAYFALRRRVSSIRQALVTMGISQLKQWVYLLSFNNDFESDESREAMLKLSFLRANYAMVLSDHIKDLPIIRSEVYMMGMFSTLQYMIDAPLEEILEEVPVAQEIKDALLKQEGICGSLYKLILSYENADWKAVKSLSNELGIPSSLLAQTYMDCVETVNEIWEGVVSNADRETENIIKEAHT